MIRKEEQNWFKLFVDCLIELQKYKVNINLTKDKFIFLPEENNIHVKGYWNDSNSSQLTFGCAMGKTEPSAWMMTFAHEFCHFIQWREKTQEWINFNELDGNIASKIYTDEKLNQKQIDYYLNTMRDIEIDCEKRTVRLLDQYKIPYNKKEYIRSANVYIHFYNHIKVYRKWYSTKNVPYMMDSLKQVTSTRFYRNYDEIPDMLKKQFHIFFPVNK